MDELFETEEQLSPRLAWMRKHNISTYRVPHMEIEEEPWCAWTGNFGEAIETDEFKTGQTEDEALLNFAKHHGLKLWNEE